MEIENIINSLFSEGLFNNIHYVNENPAIINSTKYIKVDQVLNKIETSEKYELDEEVIILNQRLVSLRVRESIKNKFLSLFENEIYFKYFKRGIFKNLFIKKDPNKILNLFKDKEWIITSVDIIHQLSLLNNFEYISSNGDIRLVGKIENTFIYKLCGLSTENIIYTGNKIDINPIFNKDIVNKDDLVKIQYKFISSGNLQKIIVK